MITEKQQGMIFNIQSFSIHDGPGVRTTVFLKGCPLNCLWCHNPESQRKGQQLMVVSNACIGCGRCVSKCPVNAIKLENDKAVTDRSLCQNCGACVKECAQNARRICGSVRTVDEIMVDVLKDKDFFDGSDGGMTLSGGEVLAQPGFTLALLKKAKKEGLHTCVDTTGYATWEVLDEIRKFTDLFLYDLKIMDPQRHQRLTGVTNDLILSNVVKLYKAGAALRIRIPIIPGMNDDQENMRMTAGFIRGRLEAKPEVDLLPYHSLGDSKLEELEDRSRILGLDSPSREDMEALRKIFESCGIKASIGG